VVAVGEALERRYPARMVRIVGVPAIPIRKRAIRDVEGGDHVIRRTVATLERDMDEFRHAGRVGPFRPRE
jgi:hypothetical protein